jgi:hypothetical protein
MLEGAMLVKIAVAYFGFVQFVSRVLLPLPFGLFDWLATKDQKAQFKQKLMPVMADVGAQLRQGIDAGAVREVYPDYLVVCENCHVILAASGGSKEENAVLALESGWFVDHGKHHCPACWSISSIPQDPGVVCKTRS